MFLPTASTNLKSKHPLVDQIEPGLVYLVSGSLQQIVWLNQDLGIELLYEPTTQEMISTLNHPTDEERTVIIIPKALDKPKKRGESSRYALPSEDLLDINDLTYAFFLGDECAALAKAPYYALHNYYFVFARKGKHPYSALHSERKKLYKAVVGGVYKELDLTMWEPLIDERILEACENSSSEYKEIVNIFYDQPFNLLAHLGEQVEHEGEEFWNQTYLDTLGTAEGIEIWANMPEDLITRYLLPHIVHDVELEPGVIKNVAVSSFFKSLTGKLDKFVPFENCAETPVSPSGLCPSLALYLQPFLHLIQARRNRAPQILRAFAAWVFSLSLARHNYYNGWSKNISSRGKLYYSFRVPPDLHASYWKLVNHLYLTN